MNFVQIDFNQAWIRHSMFRTRLRAYLLSGSGDTELLTNHHKCPLGVWLEEVALKYALKATSLLEVTYLHEEAHSEAARVIRLFRQNQVEEARAALSQVEAIDQKLLQALNELEKEVTV